MKHRCRQAAGFTIAEVLRPVVAQNALPLPSSHWKILRALCACRTIALGGHLFLCSHCQREHFVAHSCRNRHCPQCQGNRARQWLEAQAQCLLPVPYFHMVFTLPHALNPLIRQNQRALFNLLFDAVNRTLLKFGRQRLRAEIGVTAVLHTWGQTLIDHYHLHCIVTGGGLALDGSQWVKTPAHFLFPVRALGKMFQGKFCAGLQKLYARKQLEFHGQLQSLKEESQFQKLMRQATSKRWVVYAKRPFAGPRQVLKYLSRYTHRVAISNHRLLAVNTTTVAFRYRDYADASKPKVMSLGTIEFVRRFCLHLLPERFVKIRHYGFLRNRGRKTRIEQARRLLPTADPPKSTTPQVKEPAQRLCPVCQHGVLVFVREILSHRPTLLDSS
jgi:hypothetical protein